MESRFIETIFLASKSPRRKFLLETSGFRTQIINIDVDESYPKNLETKDVAEYISNKKALACQAILDANQIGVTADTIVVYKDQVLGKPENEMEAYSTLKKLSGQRHIVYTGVSIVGKEKIESFTVRSDVFLKELTDEEIHFYIKKDKPFDKAGSYGIQDWIGYAKLDRIEGSYSNIMGLPMSELYDKLSKMMTIHK